MPTVPETGTGLSGFLAHGLWLVYRHFPLSGTWDWILLVALLGVLVRALFVPHLWMAVRDDMRILQARTIEPSGQDVWTFLWDTVSMWFLVWFFHTAAGRTFLQGRHAFGVESPSHVHRGIYFLSIVLCLGLGIALIRLSFKVDARNAALSPGRPTPYTDRGFLSLYGGGGVYLRHQGSETKIADSGSIVWVEAFILFCAHLVYWYWSVATLALFVVFLATGVGTEAVRMGFVYVLHKRTFG